MVTALTSPLPVSAVDDTVSLKPGDSYDIKGNSGCTCINIAIQSGAALIVTTPLGFLK